MAYENDMVPRLRELLTEKEVWGYSRKKKAELIVMLGASDTQPSPQPQTSEPLRPQCTKPPNPTRPPPPSPTRPPFRLPILPPIRWSKRLAMKPPKMKKRSSSQERRNIIWKATSSK